MEGDQFFVDPNKTIDLSDTIVENRSLWEKTGGAKGGAAPKIKEELNTPVTRGSLRDQQNQRIVDLEQQNENLQKTI